MKLKIDRLLLVWRQGAAAGGAPECPEGFQTFNKCNTEIIQLAAPGNLATWHPFNFLSNTNVELVDINNVQVGRRHWRQSGHSRSSLFIMVDNASWNAQGEINISLPNHIYPYRTHTHTQSDGVAVSVFVHDLKSHSSRSTLARNAFKRVKTVRHPYVLG